MIGILVAIKSILEIDAAVGALGALDAGLNIVSLFSILKEKLPKDSIDFQMINALDESLKESCKILGWLYDDMATYTRLDVENILSSTVMTKDSLDNILELLTGKQIDEKTSTVFIDCFDKSVARKPELSRYLNQKWQRYIGEPQNNKIGSVDFKPYYEEVERKFTAKKRGEYRKLVGEEPDETSYIDAYITKEEKQISVLSFLEDWVGTTEPGVILIHGEPGHGKTMLCDKAMFEFYKGRFLKEKAKNVVAVSLNTGKNIRIIDNGEVKLENALVWGTAPKRKFTFEACHGSLLFLDGFDEFIDKAKEANIRNIHSFMDTVDEIAAKYGIHVVVLSRTIAVSRDLQELDRSFEYYKLSPITDVQQNRWFDQHNEYDDYREAFNTLRNDENMQKLLRVPFLFRLIVNSRFETVTSNIVDLYDNLFDHLMRKREICNEARETVKEGLMNLAFEIYCTDTLMAKMDWDPQWVFAFYVESSDGDRIGFFHRTFYQYFLAKYIYSNIITITDDNVEDFIGLLAERELDDTVRQYLSLMFKKEDESTVFPNVKKIIDTLAKTEASLNLTPRVESGDAERSKILRSTNIYRNTLHIAAAVFYVIQMRVKGNLDLMIRTYNSERIVFCSERGKKADLSGANLSGAKLYGANLSGIDLSGADLSGADLREANLNEANLSGAKLYEANLSGAKLYGAILSGAKLDEANLRGAQLRRADLGNAFMTFSQLDISDLREADLGGADLRGANLSNAKLNGANLIGADLNKANLRGAKLNKANLFRRDLRGADLREADLSGANLSGADLSGAILRKGYLSGTYLIQTNLSGADLSGANLSGAYLSGADLIRPGMRGADLNRANLRGVDLSGADLSEAIINIKHKGIINPSTKGYGSIIWDSPFVP